MSKIGMTQEELMDINIYAPLSKKQEIYLNDKENDIIIWGGSAASGKSFLSAMDMLVNGFEDPHFRSTIIRRQKEMLKQAGGLFDECTQMFQQFGVRPRGNTMDFKFPDGAYIKMAHSDAPKDKYSFQGSQCTTFLVDEAQQCNEENVVYLLSRLRSKSKAKHQLKLTCNPDYDSFIRVWLEKGNYLDDEGKPKPEMDGVTTYYAEVAGETVILPSLEDFYEMYGKDYVKEELEPLKLVFYAANVHDNPWVCKHQKGYVSKLKNMKRIERLRLYEGSWYAKEEASGYFKRDWVTEVWANEIPLDMRLVRCWDKASTKPSSAYPDPDWTVGIKGGLDSAGNLWIINVKRLRDRPAIVQNFIQETGLEDGKHVLVGIPQDVGGAGKDAMETSKAGLMRCGLNVVVNRATKGKALRFEPVAVAAQNREIYVVKGDWNEAFYAELESLDFESRKRGKHDDQADALSDLYHVLRTRMIAPVIKPNKSRSVNKRNLTLI